MLDRAEIDLLRLITKLRITSCPMPKVLGSVGQRRRGIDMQARGRFRDAAASARQTKLEQSGRGWGMPREEKRCERRLCAIRRSFARPSFR